MGEVFSGRSVLYWWGLLTASVFIKDWLSSLADLLQKSNTFVRDRVPFNMLPGLNGWIDQLAEYVRKAVDFKPDQVIATIGPLAVQGWVVALLFGIMLIVLGVRLYIRALRTSSWFDDFFTLFVLYIILRFEGHIVGATNLPLQDWFKSLVTNQAVSFFLISILLLVLTFAGEGLRSKRAFWRALIALGLVALFIYPTETASAFGYIVQAWAFFGDSLGKKENFAFTAIWGLVGLLLAIHRLTTPEAEISGGGGRDRKPRAEAKE